MTSTFTLRSLDEPEHSFAFTKSRQQLDGAIPGGCSSDDKTDGGTPRECYGEAWREQRLHLTRAQVEAQLSDRLAGAFARRRPTANPLRPTAIRSLDGAWRRFPY